MLFLVFQIGEDRYALNTAQVVRVFPLVAVKNIPHSPQGVAGVFIYQGSPVPLVDFSDLALGRPAERLMSTRIFLAHYSTPNGEKRLLGLLVERATDTIRREAADFTDPGVAPDGAPYLGPVTTDALGIIQRIEIDQLLSEEVRDLLFRQPLECA